VDGVEATRIAARYNMPFDIPTNEELGGVPPHKAFAGMLVMAQLGRRLGAQPILKPLLCHGPYVMVQGLMEQNYVDYNFAKIRALQAMADFPIWPGEPIGFMTHDEEKVQSAANHRPARGAVRDAGPRRDHDRLHGRSLLARAHHLGRPHRRAAWHPGNVSILRRNRRLPGTASRGVDRSAH
jgi:hypothetical protein